MAESSMTERPYFGIYCAQCNEWLTRQGEDVLLFYPTKSIAKAHLETRAKYWHFNSAQVAEFGTEVPVDVKALPAGSAVCGFIVSERNYESAGSGFRQ